MMQPEGIYNVFRSLDLDQVYTNPQTFNWKLTEQFWDVSSENGLPNPKKSHIRQQSHSCFEILNACVWVYIETRNPSAILKWMDAL